MPVENPDELESVDQEIRISELKAQAAELTGGQMGIFEDGDAPPELLEEFWKSVVETEKAGWTTGRRQMEEDGVALPPPDKLDDGQIADKLRELLDRLARRCTYVFHTDHMSDRQLYERMWDDSLNESFSDRPVKPGYGGYFIDLVGSGSEEHTYLHHKYYADEKNRQDWLEEWPDYDMPAHEDPPYDRDRTLPKPPEVPGGPKWY